MENCNGKFSEDCEAMFIADEDLGQRYLTLYGLANFVSTFFLSLQEVCDDRVEGIWRQVLDVFRGGILADW